MHDGTRLPFLRISLSGSAGAGKDYLATILREKWGVVPLSFAEPMKRLAGEVLGLTLADVERIKADKTHEKHHAMRYVLQHIGTNVFRDGWDENVWVDNLLRRADAIARGDVLPKPKVGAAWVPPRGVVVTDCRFTNEWAALGRAGFLRVDVTAPAHFLRLPRPPAWAMRLHALPILSRLVPKRYRAALHPSERDLDAVRDEGLFDLTVHNDRETPADALVERIVSHAARRAWEVSPTAEVVA